MKDEYTAKEAAEMVGVNDSRIRQLAAAGEIEHKYFGKMLVITAKGIEEAKQRKGRGRPKGAKNKPKK